MNENNIAETCLCNSGIASGNLNLHQQKNIIDQFYRTAIGGAGFHKRDSSSEGNSEVEAEQEEDEEEEEEEENLKSDGKKLKNAWY